jgi:diamine N-acetyltransferase
LWPETRSGLWRLNIDAAHQGRGYGRFAVDATCEFLASRRRDEFAYVTWEPGEHGPEAFYLGLGFEPTGELSGSQTVARRRL